VDIEDNIAEVVAQRHANRRIVGEQQTTLVLVRQPDLLFGAELRIRHHATHGATLQYHLDLARGVPIVELDALLRIYALERMAEASHPLVWEPFRRARNHGRR